MWLIASFDLPSTGHEAAKRYRRLRKVLISSGFSFVQKSVAWRWCENHEHCDGIIAKVLKPLSVNGDMLFFSIPDSAFRNTMHISGGNVHPPPDVPQPWTIFA